MTTSTASAKEVIDRLKWDPELLGSSKKLWSRALIYLKNVHSAPGSLGCRSWTRTGICEWGRQCKHSHDCDLSYLEGMMDGKTKSSSGMALITSNDITNLKAFNMKLAHRVVFVSINGSVVYDAEYPQAWPAYLKKQGLLEPDELDSGDHARVLQSTFPLVCLHRVMGFLGNGGQFAMYFVCRSWRLDVAMNVTEWEAKWQTMTDRSNARPWSDEVSVGTPSFCKHFRAALPKVNVSWTLAALGQQPEKDSEHQPNRYNLSLEEVPATPCSCFGVSSTPLEVALVNHVCDGSVNVGITTAEKTVPCGSLRSVQSLSNYEEAGKGDAQWKASDEEQCIGAATQVESMPLQVANLPKLMTYDHIHNLFQSMEVAASRTLSLPSSAQLFHMCTKRGLVTIVTTNTVQFYDIHKLIKLGQWSYTPLPATSVEPIRGISGQYFVEADNSGRMVVVDTSDSDLMSTFSLWSCVVHGIGVSLDEFLVGPRIVGLDVTGSWAVFCVQSYDTQDNIGGDLTAILVDLKTKVVVNTMTIGCFEAIFHQVQIAIELETSSTNELTHSPRWVTVTMCYMPTNVMAFRMALNGESFTSEVDGDDGIVSVTQHIDPQEVSYEQNSADVYGMQVIDGGPKVVVYCAKNCMRFFDLQKKTCNMVFTDGEVLSIDPSPFRHGFFFVTMKENGHPEATNTGIWDANIEAPISSGYLRRYKSPKLLMKHGVVVWVADSTVFMSRHRTCYREFQKRVKKSPNSSAKKSRRSSKGSSKPNRASRELKSNMHKRRS